MSTKLEERLSQSIQSIGEQMGVEYKRPADEKLTLYREALKDNPEALTYLESKRGLAKDTIEHFRLGYDAKRNAIAIPVFKDRKLINFKYRLLDENAKTRYTSEAGAETWIYNEDGIEKAKVKGTLLIVEGEFDLMSVWQAGSANVVSPASGKDSYGTWIEKIDSVPKIYIAYDNDKGGKETALKMAERLGLEKCIDVVYPDGIKDANEYFKKYNKDEFVKLVKSSRPYFTHQYKGISDVIKSLREKKSDTLHLMHIPKVAIEKDWLVVISGVTNTGKTSYVLNIADELTDKGVPTLIMPFERGVDSVGSRFLQVKFNLTVDEFALQNEDEWGKMIDKCIDTPAYFSVPAISNVIDTIVKSKRFFDTKVVIIDHLDYLIRNVGGNKEAAIGDMLKELKRVAIEHGIVMLVVSHIRKMEGAGGWKTPRKPCLDDLKGSSSLSQDPECVIMLSSDEENTISVDVLKNKGEMGFGTYHFNARTGKITGEISNF